MKGVEVCGQLHTLAALTPGESVPGTYWIGGWMGPLVCMDAVEKKKFTLLGIKHRLSMKNAIFWDVTLCGSCKNCFQGTYHLHHQGDKTR
jgi:hypothetical protein